MLIQEYPIIVMKESPCLQTAGHGQQITPLCNLKEGSLAMESG
jgi:hypothetical protein